MVYFLTPTRKIMEFLRTRMKTQRGSDYLNLETILANIPVVDYYINIRRRADQNVRYMREKGVPNVYIRIYEKIASPCRYAKKVLQCDVWNSIPNIGLGLLADFYGLNHPFYYLALLMHFFNAKLVFRDMKERVRFFELHVRENYKLSF